MYHSKEIILRADALLKENWSGWKEGVPPTKTQLWHYSLLIDKNGKRDTSIDSGRLLFYSANLPFSSAKLPRSESPRVLVVATNSGLNTLLQERLSELRRISEEHEILSPEFVVSSEIALFWNKFFGNRDYCGSIQNRELPALIISTGIARNHEDATGHGETVSVKGRLKEIASEWEIPISFIDSIEN